jgi:beta-galactosidase
MVEGDGKLIGFDNGNPVDHDSMKGSRRNVFNGLALAVIQPGKKPGSIRVQADSPALRGASVQIDVRQSNDPPMTVENLGK